MTTTKAPLPLGEQISCPAGTATVSVTHIRTGVYRVETLNWSGSVIQNWTRSYSDETVARMAGTHAVIAFRQWGTADRIAAEDERLRFVTRDLLNSRRDTRQQLADTEAAIEAIEDLDTWGQLALAAA